MSCEHEFRMVAEVYCYENRPGLGAVDLTGKCTKCPAVLEFLGLECGVNLNGPAVSPDNREARLAVSITEKPAMMRHDRVRVVM